MKTLGLFDEGRGNRKLRIASKAIWYAGIQKTASTLCKQYGCLLRCGQSDAAEKDAFP